MAYVTVPKDLTHVKSKVVFWLTKRQPICFSGALVIGVPLYFLTRDYISNSAAALLMVFAMLPGFLLAMYERHGQPLEVVIMQIIQCCFIKCIQPLSGEKPSALQLAARREKEKPSIRAQLQASKAEQGQKPPAREKSKGLEVE